MAVEPGTIVLLNGAAGAGKTSICRQIQQLATTPFLYAGIDTFLRMLPARYLEGEEWLDVMGQHDRPGETGRRLVSGMHGAIAALARAGTSVAADHVMVEPRWLTECATLFAGLRAYLVGVHCPPAELERRERERADRVATVGEVARQLPIVHADKAYDVELDTASLSPDEAARAVLDHAATVPPRALALFALFERAPSFIRRLLDEPWPGSWAAQLERAQETALSMPEPEQLELLDAHPRIGAAPADVSALSYGEQGYSVDPGTAELQARLDALNDAYESRHGFRFIVFVAGRSRADIADVIAGHADSEREAEKQRALRDVIAIARDRAVRLGIGEEVAGR